MANISRTLAWTGEQIQFGNLTDVICVILFQPISTFSHFGQTQRGAWKPERRWAPLARVWSKSRCVRNLSKAVPDRDQIGRLGAFGSHAVRSKGLNPKYPKFKGMTSFLVVFVFVCIVQCSIYSRMTIPIYDLTITMNAWMHPPESESVYFPGRFPNSLSLIHYAHCPTFAITG